MGCTRASNGHECFGPRHADCQSFNPGGKDGRIGPETVAAIRAYQLKVGFKPSDGYAGLKVLARLRQGT